MPTTNYRLEGTYPYVDESLAAMEFAYRDGDIRHVKAALANEIFKHASESTRKRAMAMIVQRFLPFDKNTFQVTRTPWLEFVNRPFSRDAKVKVLWYIYARGNSLYPSVLQELSKDGLENTSRAQLGEVTSKVVGRTVQGKAVDVIAVSLRDFGMFKFEKKDGKFVQRLVPNMLPFPAFAFVLYQHFLDQGTIVPKMNEVKEFFRNWYNQPDAETERLVRTALHGFWVLERMAHLDQLALLLKSMDDVLKRLAESPNGSTRG